MYRTREHQLSIYDYLPPYHGELAGRNRWVRLAEAIDWDAFEREYSGHFGHAGKVALPARVAYGCLIIRAALGVSDRETVALIRESPYLQYFLGFPPSPTTCPSPRAAWSGSAPASRPPGCGRPSPCCAGWRPKAPPGPTRPGPPPCRCRRRRRGKADPGPCAGPPCAEPLGARRI